MLAKNMQETLVLFYSIQVTKCCLWLLLQQSTFACLRHVADDETGLSCAASRCRLTSLVDRFFSLLISSVDAAHRPVVNAVTADFIRLLTRLISSADMDFTLKVLVSLTVS